MILAKYLRLSKDDMNSEKESNSITNQRMFIEQFVKGHDDLKDMQLLEFVDDGFTGTNFERPGFLKMMELAKKGNINVIIVKDLSRFGRNESDVSEYLEQIFPFLNIRFISINDHFDTIHYKGNSSKLHITLINIFHEYTSLELSFKIKSSLALQRKTGQHVGASYPYGFCKKAGAKNQLFIDHEAAKVVKRIFSMTLEGKGRSEIVRVLNQEEVLSPCDYKRLKKCKEKHILFQKKHQWGVVQLTNILRDEEYIGTGISGKFYRPVIGKAHVKHIAKEQWMRTPNAHEAIISKEDFEKVQKTFQNKKIDFTQKNGIFTGFIICGCCNHNLKIRRNKEVIKYYCDSYRFHPALQCPHETYTEEELAVIVTPIILKQIQVFCEFNTLLIEKQQIQKNMEKENKINSKKLEGEIRFLKMKQKQNYEDLKMGYISKELYLFQKERFSIRLQEIEALYHGGFSLKVRKQQLLPFESSAKNFFYEKLNREILTDFVKKIYVYGKREFKIEYRFEEQFKKIGSKLK